MISSFYSGSVHAMQSSWLFVLQCIFGVVHEPHSAVSLKTLHTLLIHNMRIRPMQIQASAWESIFLCQGWGFSNFLQLLQLNLLASPKLRHDVISDCCENFPFRKIYLDTCCNFLIEIFSSIFFGTNASVKLNSVVCSCSDIFAGIRLRVLIGI